MKTIKKLLEQQGGQPPQTIETLGYGFVLIMSEQAAGGMKGGMKSSVMSELTARQREILALMEKNAELSLKDISALQKHITKLKEKGVLKRIGPVKGGRWEVKTEK